MSIKKTKMTNELPKLGEKLVRLPNYYARNSCDVFDPLPCTVTYVNPDHGWYQVTFSDSGIVECYKLPGFDHDILRGIDPRGGSVPCVCIETGTVYRSFSDCASDMGVSHSAVCRAVNGVYESVGGYHFYSLL